MSNTIMTKTKKTNLDDGTDVKVLSSVVSKYKAFKSTSEKAEKPAERIQKLKNEIIKLIDTLQRDKAITKPTYNRYEKYSYKPKIHEATLKEKVDELKFIQQEWKSGAKERVTGNISNKFTLKELKGLKDTVKEEKKNEYVVYMKLKITSSDVEKDKITKMSIQDFENAPKYCFCKDKSLPPYHVHETYEDNATFNVLGKQNVQNEVKQYIDYQLTYPYVIKVQVLQLTINKSIASEVQYRWLGAEKTKNKHNASYIKYFKAWASTMAFKYHGYDLDMNDETEFECVPSALWKMYGDKSKTSHIPFVVHGGTDCVRTILDSFEVHTLPMQEKSKTIRVNEQVLVDGVLKTVERTKFVGKCEDLFELINDKRVLKEKFKGYTPEHILMFCNRFKIRCFGFDWKFKQFITNRDSGMKFNNDLRAFVFYMNDQHIYLIENEGIRKSILHSSDKSDIISLMAKQREMKESKRGKAVDLSFKQWSKVEKTDIFITDSGRVNDVFYELLGKGHVYNNKLKMNDKDGIVRFEYKNKNMIIYNPDYFDVVQTIEKLNPELYKFKNQRLNTLAKEVLDKEFGGYALSTMNKAGDEIFHSDFIRNCQFNGWLSEPVNTTKKIRLANGSVEMKEFMPNLSAYDYNKHYTSCLMGMDMEFGWPIYNIFDEVKKFDGKMQAGFYYVECEQVFPFRGNGWYDADLVSYGVETGLIKAENIMYQYKPSNVLPLEYFKKFVEYVYATFVNPKDAINKLLGCFGHDFTNKSMHHFTTDGRLAFMEVDQNKEVKVKYVFHDKFNNEGGEIDIKELDINKYITNEKPLCYHIYNTKEVKQFQNALPFFYKIYNVSAVKMHKMAQQVGGVVRGIFTDTIIFQDAVNVPPCDPSVIGGIRESSVKDFTKCMGHQPRKACYTLSPAKLNSITEFKLSDDKGMYLTGLAGTGKSTKTNQIKADLSPEKFVVSASTHTSALIVGGATIFNTFNINPHDFTYLKSTPEKLKKAGVEWVFVDEISMIPSPVWAVLRDIKKIYGFKFILVGDFGQLPAVEAKSYDVERSEVFAELCDGRKMELTENWRAKNDSEFAVFVEDLMKAREGRPIDYTTYGSKECRRSLAWTNRTRKTINSRWMLEEAKTKKHFLIDKFKVFVGLPIIANETRTFKKKEKQAFEVKNNEQFTVSQIDATSVTITNTRMTLSIEHKEFKYFDLAYCITVHKAQGQTFDFEYTIYEHKRYDKKLLYTAMSRSTQKSNIHFCSFGAGILKKGWIYKITDCKGKIYIGKTSTSVEQRWGEHQQCMDGAPLHAAIQRDGVEGWTCETVKEVEYADDEELSIAETVQMMHHNSIVQGYNTKFSVAWDYLY